MPLHHIYSNFRVWSCQGWRTGIGSRRRCKRGELVKFELSMAAQYSLLQLFLVAGMLSLAGAKAAAAATSSRQAQVEWDATARSGVVRLSNGSEVHVFPAEEHDQPGQVIVSDVKKHWISRKNNSSSTTHRRMLGDFRQCSPCTCCDRSRRWCLPTVCCYNIRCGVTGLPFGLCSFVPISCTCFGCRS